MALRGPWVLLRGVLERRLQLRRVVRSELRNQVPVPLGFRRAVDPARRAARVVLLLPDRHARLGLVDDVAARVERGPTMVRADADPNGAVPDRELADAMLAVHGRDGETRHGLGNDALTFLLGDRLMRFVLERLHGFAFVVIADPAFERHAGARRAAFELTLARGRIDDGGGDLERHGG